MQNPKSPSPNLLFEGQGDTVVMETTALFRVQGFQGFRELKRWDEGG